MIRIVTDSNSQLPPELVERYRVTVVPLTVTVDGVDYLEGVDLDADSFFARFSVGAPEVSTSQPSPGRFLEAYRALEADGATEIVSIHIGSNLSGTLNAARAAASRVGVPVHLVDTQIASFGISFAVWEAAEALASGADVAGAIEAAQALLPRVRTVFIVQAIDLANSGGRMQLGDAAGIPVLTFDNNAVGVLAHVHSFDEAVDTMADHVLAGGGSLRVAVGVADASANSMTEALQTRLEASDRVSELVHYRVGPSIAAHSGPGTVGVFWVER